MRYADFYNEDDTPRADRCVFLFLAIRKLIIMRYTNFYNKMTHLEQIGAFAIFFGTRKLATMRYADFYTIVVTARKTRLGQDDLVCF